MKSAPSVALQQAIAVSLGDSVLRASDLADRVMAHGFAYRGYVTNAIQEAAQCGMIVRIGASLQRQYKLNPDWKIDPAALIKARAQRRRIMQADNGSKLDPPAAGHAYQGPAFGEGPLVPSLGTVCGAQEDLEGELPPYLGGRIVDSLHHHFDRILAGVE